MKDPIKHPIQMMHQPCDVPELDLVHLIKSMNDMLLNQENQASRLKSMIKEFKKRCKGKYPNFNWKYYGL